MPSGERIGGNNGEDSGNKESRELYQARGEMTVEAELEAREQERLKALERERELAKMYEAIVNEKKTSELIKKAAKAMIEDPEFATALDKAAEESSDKPEAESGQQTAEGQGETSNEQPTGNTGEASSEGPETPPVVVGAPGEASTDSTPESNDNPERVDGDSVEVLPADPETVNRIAEKSKKNGGLKKVITSIGALALAGVMAATALFGIKTGKDEVPDNNAIGIENMTEDPISPEDFETAEAVKGIKDGYGEKGMWLSNTKSSPHAFASAGEVAEVCDDDEVEMVKYTAENQVESFSDYLANLPEQLQPEGFKGLSIIDTEHKLESLSDDEFDQMRQQFNGIMDQAFTRRVVLNGEYQNAYMTTKNEVDVPTHDDMQIVECTTTENNLEVTQFYWVDENGNEIGSMTIKIIHNEDGSISGCEQVVNKKGEKVHLYEKLESIQDPEPEPTGSEPTGNEPTGSEPTGSEPTGSEPTGSEPTGSEPTGSEPTGAEPTGAEPTGAESTGAESTGAESTGAESTGAESTGTEVTPKNEQAEIDNAGDHVDQQPLDENVTPSTTVEQDQANFDAIEQQKQEDAAAQAEAERKEQEQAAAEQAAAAEAEKRKQEQEAAAAAQAQADADAAARAEAEKQAAAEAERKAQEQAAAEQAARAEAEKQAAAEQAAREQAQREEEARAEAERKAAEAAANDTADDRAQDFENGDF